MYKLISALIGVIVAIMASFNGTLANHTGTYLSLVIIHFVGLIGIVLILVAQKKKLVFKKAIPLYLYSAGAIGVFTVMFTNLSINSLGASITFALSLLGQSIASIFLDHYGFLGMKVMKFNSKKILGIVIIALGIAAMIFIK